MSFHDPLTVVGPIALALPLLVTFVMCVVAHRGRSTLPAGALLRLLIATIAAIVASLFFPHPIGIVLTTATLFCVFALPVMRALERSVIDRMTPDPVRSALLLPRLVGTYVPLWARRASIVAGLAGLCWVTARAATAARPLMMAIGFTFAAVTFFALYEIWLRQEVFSVRATDDGDRRRRVRAIFAAQTILTLSFLIMAGLSAGTWPGLVPLGVIGGITGGLGCAFALSTGVEERYLQAWSARP